ncbi:hypothetical protein IVA94_36775 [Bradyrhizobium sp. 156]|uniref:hypothetical protein n=1 Tax=Bradyrhizobium sp. 156 TaxID=2782630 RepID=UPI001FF964A7|nr:hypothetical protein [Bradyrhizobium sp. 156]MCK1326323.1 hypothetical protein [Bradyrhizobium sp. 156]
MKREETYEERIARRRARYAADLEESERRRKTRAAEQRVESLAKYIEWLEARGAFGLEDNLIEPWRFW